MGKQINNVPSFLDTVDLNGVDVIISVAGTGTSSTPTGLNSDRGTATTGGTAITSGGSAATSNTQTASSTTNPSGTSDSTHASDKSPQVPYGNRSTKHITLLHHQWYCSSLLDSVTTSDRTSTAKSGIEIEASTSNPGTPVPPASFEAGVITGVCDNPHHQNRNKPYHPESTSLPVTRTIFIANTIIDPIPTSAYTFAGVGRIFTKDTKHAYAHSELADPISRLHLVAVNHDIQPSDPTLQWMDVTIQ